MTHDRVVFLESAVGDLRALQRKDPALLRAVLKQVLLVNRDPRAGVALRGPLAGYRKLTVGDRHWRLIWRIATDGVVEIAEVWGAGAREDQQIYAEIGDRIQTLPDDALRLSLADVLDAISAACEVVALDPPMEPMPPWLATALADQVGLTAEQIAGLTPEEGNARLAQWYSRLRP